MVFVKHSSKGRGWKGRCRLAEVGHSIWGQCGWILDFITGGSGTKVLGVQILALLLTSYVILSKLVLLTIKLEIVIVLTSWD